jgi:multiple antibiotic resistance protein
MNMGELKSFLLTIIPVMVAINAFGVLPIYLGLTEEMDETARRRIARQSVITAFMITMGFVFLGQAVFRLLGIHVEDFMIAGGILLLVISIADMVRVEETRAMRSPTLGVVPLGTPLLAGPATLTTALLLVNDHGYLPVVASLIVNLGFAWAILDRSDVLIRLVGINGARAFAKVSSLLLAAIAVKLIRSGIMRILGE